MKQISNNPASEKNSQTPQLENVQATKEAITKDLNSLVRKFVSPEKAEITQLANKTRNELKTALGEIESTPKLAQADIVPAIPAADLIPVKYIEGQVALAEAVQDVPVDTFLNTIEFDANKFGGGLSRFSVDQYTT